MKIEKLRSRIDFKSCLPLIFGLFVFLVVVGPRVLDPQNIGWLGVGDFSTHYMGWLFFRYVPWDIPVGRNPNYGLELSNSIIYSDSNPLLAILFKPFGAFLPEPFQYSGGWILFCFVLQGLFGWKLVGLVTRDIPLRLLGAGMFLFSPPMFARLYGHLSLSSHFLILASLYFTLNSKLKHRRLCWGILLVATATVHAYLIAMVGLIWLADLFSRAVRNDILRKGAFIEFFTILAAIVFTCWQVGYFSVVSGTSAGGFGVYRMNVFSIFDPSGWSYVIPDIPEGAGDYEGFNYLGLGNLLLLAIAVPFIATNKVRLGGAASRNFSLLVALACLAAFSLSNRIAFGGFEFVFSLPKFLLDLANIFRASGRMFWPVFYALVLVTIWVVVQGAGRRTATVALGLALMMQAFDTSAGWLGLRQILMTNRSSHWHTALTDPFWTEAASIYKRLRYIPTGGHSDGLQQLTYYAGTHGMATDAVYLARVDRRSLEKAQQNTLMKIQTGSFDRNTLYILDDYSFRSAVSNIDESVDLAAKVDGFNVLAPGWSSCSDCSPSKSRIKLVDLISFVRIGDRIEFGETKPGLKYLGRGWSLPEQWGIWNDGGSAQLYLKAAEQPISSILIEARALVSPSYGTQRLSVSINGIPAADLSLIQPAVEFEVQVPDAVKRSDASYLEVEFDFSDAARPKDIGLGDDERDLAVGLIALTVR